MWSQIHAERAALADDLSGLDREQWATRSLCGRWSVEEVVAHLTAAASLGRFRWLRTVVGARGSEALTMTLAGRSAYLDEQSGTGVALLRDRIDSGDK